MVTEEFGYKELQIKDGQVAAYSLDSAKKHLEEGWTFNLYSGAFSICLVIKVLLTWVTQNNTASEVESQNWFHARTASNANSAASPLISMDWLHAQLELSLHQVLLHYESLRTVIQPPSILAMLTLS